MGGYALTFIGLSTSVDNNDTNNIRNTYAGHAIVYSAIILFTYVNYYVNLPTSNSVLFDE